MTQRKPPTATPTQTLAERVKRSRARRGWTAAELADECARIGAPQLNRSVIANIESGRRKYVTVDELVALAYALSVAPIHLLVPIEHSEDAYLEVTADRFLPVAEAREWFRGRWAPAGLDPRVYWSEVPRSEWQPPTLTEQEIDERGQRQQLRRELTDRFLPKPERSG